MIDTGSLKKGIVVIMDGDLLRIADYQHVKQGRGSAFVRMTFKNVRTGATIMKTVQAGERFDVADLEHKNVSFLYRDGDDYYFMDQETFEQPTVSAQTLGDATKYLREGLVIDLLYYGDEALDVSLPPNVELIVAETEPNYKGDTSGGGKPATLETGAVTTVPFFVNRGDKVRVDTRSGEYLERVS